MPLTTEGEAFARYWGTINSAVSERADTATIFQAVRDEAARLGEDLPAGAFKGITELRSRAVQVREFAKVVERARPTDPVLGSTVPQAIWARDSQQQELMPKLSVTYQLTRELPDGSQTTDYRTAYDIDFTDGLTYGDLLDAVKESAEAMLTRGNATGFADYQGSLVSTDGLQVVGY